MYRSKRDGNIYEISAIITSRQLDEAVHLSKAVRSFIMHSLQKPSEKNEQFTPQRIDPNAVQIELTASE